MQRIAILCSRIFFATLLLAAAVGKLLDNRGFAAVLALYQLPIPVALLLPLALVFSLAELALGVGIAVGYELPVLAPANVVLHLGYLALAIATNLRRIPLSNCGCFGVFLARPMTWSTVVEDFLLALLAVGFLWAVRARGAAAARFRERRAA